MIKVTNRPGCRIWWKNYVGRCGGCNELFPVHKYSYDTLCSLCKKVTAAAKDEPAATDADAGTPGDGKEAAVASADVSTAAK